MSKALLSEALLGRVPGAALPRIVASRGHDLIDQTGSRYLDAISGAYAAILGYDLMSTVEVMTSAAEKLPYVHNARFDTDESAALAQRLSDLAGDPGYHVYFSVSGADGVEAALRIAAAAGRVRAGRSRTALASLGYSYHGSTGFALSATGHAAARSGYAGHLKPVHRLDLMRWVRSERGYQADWKRDEADIEDSIGEQTGAIVLEPMLGNAAGCVEIPDQTLSAIAAVCERNDIVLIADEVSVGTWRTSGISLSLSKGVRPDIIVLGKALTAGLFPLSAVLVSPRIVAKLNDVNLLGHTHGAHPVGCATALHVVSQVVEPAFQRHMLQLGIHFEAKLRDLGQQSGVVAIRGRGLMYSVCLDSIRGGSAKLYSACLSRGLLVMPGMTSGDNGEQVSDHVTLAPAFNMQIKVLDNVVDRLADALREL
ncbi:aminotransferase class III-fold pyridoxal phosphate-dependent enzyme [Burkholderia ambifaria]|uniref:aminotransferase class III-fold pyridoxal phosphate-dependent enzyme n=1 Tax=Burkholderia ambifaria TaxID=152480 RepID=UPI00158EB099|nr:aminotransferase class III-fold pyridoxal phosphate-dependent enzyme [Burkholderia ambifaria]